MDNQRDLPSALREKAEKDLDLRRFSLEVADVDRALRKAPLPMPEAPPGLHRSIMRAVEASGDSSQRTFPPFRWLAAPALTGLALLLGWWLLDAPRTPPTPASSAPDQSLAQAAAVLEIGGRLPAALPDTVIAPLSEELEHVHQDVNQTAQFLLSYLP